MTPLDLILHLLLKFTAFRLPAKIEVYSFNRSRDIRESQIPKVGTRLEMVWLEQPNKFGRLIWLPNLVAVNKHLSNYSVISNCE